MRRPVAALLVGVALLAACTTSPGPPVIPTPNATTPAEPLPPVGLRVGFVLPAVPLALSASTETLRQQLEALPDVVGPELSTVRVVAPESPEMAVDAAGLLASRGYDVTCILGSNAAALAEELARLYPAQWFCAAPGREDESELPNVLYLDVRLEEIGHLWGLAASGVSEPGAPVAVVRTTRPLWQDRLMAGIEAGAGEHPVVALDGADPDALRAALAELRDRGLRAVLVDADAQMAALIADDPQLLLAAPSEALQEIDADRTLMRWDVDLGMALRVVIDRVRGLTDEMPRSLGLADEVVTVELAGGLSAPLHDLLGRARAELRAGQRDPTQTAPEHRPAEPTPSPTAPGSPTP